MHEHDRYPSGSMRMKHEKPFGQFLVADCKITGAKTGNLEVPNRRAFQSQGKSADGLIFDRDIDAVNLERSTFVQGVEFKFADQFSGLERPARVVETKKRRNGYLDTGRNVDVLLTRGSLDRLDRRSERCANTRRAVAVAQAAHFNVSGGGGKPQSDNPPSFVLLAETAC